MKIVHISTSLFGGAGRAAYRLHESLLFHGYDSAFVCMDNNIDRKYMAQNITTVFRKPGIIEVLKSKFFPWKNVKMYSIRKSIELEFASIYQKLNCEIASLPFSRYKLSENPIVKSADIIILHWVGEIMDYLDFFENLKKPLIWTLHDRNPMQGIFHYENDEKINFVIAGNLDQKVKKIKFDALSDFKSTLNIVAPSNWMKCQAEQSALLSHFPACVIANSIDLNLFKLREKEIVRKELNIPINKIVFLFVSESVRNYRKGFDLLLEAIKLLSSDRILLVALGHNAQLQGINVEILNAGVITDDILLTKYYAAADAFVLPSREDNLPNVMLESFACGTPVVGFPVGGIKEHVVNYETGILAEEISSKSLASALLLFIKFKEKFNANVIRKYAENNFNGKMQVDKFKELFKAILK